MTTTASRRSATTRWQCPGRAERGVRRRGADNGRVTDQVPHRACAVLPSAPGVYRFRDERGRVLYLGRATNLRSRTQSYWGDLGDRRHLRRMIPQIATVEALTCASAHEAAWLERNLLERTLPRWNRVRGGQEVPSWLVLDPGPAHPELRLQAQPDPRLESFGPYLGSDRARLGLSGLLRVWPIHLTGDRPDAADRAFAESRAVSPESRETWLCGVRAVLGRDQAACDLHRSLLMAARDRAVAKLAFETAGQIHKELAAVGWLAAVQRVTGCDPAGLVVHGWADGLLVTLRATAGVLDTWTVRPAAASLGRELAALTPPAWQDFARSNVELAARLADAHTAPGNRSNSAPTRPSARR